MRGRESEFVTPMISRGATAITLGFANQLGLENLEAKRDWRYAVDYVRAMWLMLHQEKPSDFVIGSGETHPIREFCEVGFGSVDLDYQDYVVQDPKMHCP